MSLGGYLAFTLFIGAAFADSEPAKRQELRDALQPLIPEMRDKSTSLARWAQLAEMMLRETYRIMGDDWEMPADFKHQIKLLLRPE